MTLDNDWVTETGMYWRDVLGLHHWSIVLKATPTPKDHDDDDGIWWGDCSHTWRSLSANIRIHHELKQDDATETVVHELIHVLLSQLDHNIKRIRDFIPPRLQTHAIMLFDEALEVTTQTITQALCRIEPERPIYRLETNHCAVPIPELMMKWTDKLKLHEWNIDVKQVEPPKNADPNAQGNWCGSNEFNGRSLTSFVTINNKLPDWDIPDTVIHELVHLLVADIDTCINQIIELVPESRREYTRELALDALEPVVVMLTHAFIRLDKLPTKEVPRENPSTQTP